MSLQEIKCCLCNMQFLDKALLQEHFRKHANKEIDMKGRLVSLGPAKGRFTVTNPVKTNITPGEMVKCDVCPEVFDTVTKAIQHKFKKHPEVSSKNFCQYCGKQFPLKFTLDKHLNSHSELPVPNMRFQCLECDAVFYNADAKDYHYSSTHKRNLALFQPTITPPPSKKIKINNAREALSVYYCHLCGTEYIVKFNLQKHLERQHTAEERNAIPRDLIKCTTCDALFYNKKAYDTHNIYHKPEDLYVTTEEQRLQTVARVDQDFDIRRVQTSADKYIPAERSNRSRRKNNTNADQIDKAKTSKINTDDELSPVSSAESSDEDAAKSEKKKKIKLLKSQLNLSNNGKVIHAEGEIQIIKQDSKILFVKKITDNKQIIKNNKKIQKLKNKIINNIKVEKTVEPEIKSDVVNIPSDSDDDLPLSNLLKTKKI